MLMEGTIAKLIVNNACRHSAIGISDSLSPAPDAAVAAAAACAVEENSVCLEEGWSVGGGSMQGPGTASVSTVWPAGSW